MTDAEQVAAIDRAAELRLLEQLLAERGRRVPPPPPYPYRGEPLVDTTLLGDLMRLIAEAMTEPQLRRVA